MPRVKQFNEEEVLQKAVAVFWKKGYHATSIQDLVNALGINRASIYHTFGDKQQLFERAFNLYRQSSGDWVKGFLSGFESVHQGFHGLFERAIDESIADPDHKGCFVVNSITELIPGESSIEPILADHTQGITQLFEEYLQQGVDSGEISPDKDLQSIATMLFTLYNGLKVVTKITRDRDKLLGMANTALSVLKS